MLDSMFPHVCYCSYCQDGFQKKYAIGFGYAPDGSEELRIQKTDNGFEIATPTVDIHSVITVKGEK